jgi:uncharacterized protein
MVSVVLMAVAVAAGLYVVVVVLLFGLQGRLVFPVNPLHDEPAEVGLADMYVIAIGTALGPFVLGWYRAPVTPDKPTILMFHGNGESLSGRAHIARDLIDAGYGVFHAEYRGYGGNPGRPTERGLYADGRTAVDFLEKREATIVAHGYSLGSGVAMQLAREGRVHALILEAPYTSIADVAARRFPLLPVRWLVLNRFENLAKIGQVKVPLAIYAGTADLVIPHEHAQRLFSSANEPKRLLTIDGAGHTDCWTQGGSRFVMRFLADVQGNGRSAKRVTS